MQPEGLESQSHHGVVDSRLTAQCSADSDETTVSRIRRPGRNHAVEGERQPLRRAAGAVVDALRIRGAEAVSGRAASPWRP